MKYYVDDQGVYLGGWDENPPEGAIEVPYAPGDARQVWQFPGYSDVPVAIPASITRRQGRRALLQAGKLVAVESAIAAISDPAQQMVAQIEYENATWERANPWVNQLGQAIDLSAEQIDELFILGATY